MSLSQDLLGHASELLSPAFNGQREPNEVNLRRSMSASYYALFHQINEDAAALIAPNVSLAINHRIRRWFDHLEVKTICGRFTKQQLDQPLLGLIGPVPSLEIKRVATTLIHLQGDRHLADYDVGFQPTLRQATINVLMCHEAVASWKQVKGTAEANIFILSLLLWKNWEKDRS